MGFMFILVPILSIGIIVFTIVLMFSPKLRGKMMSNNVKATKYMMDESKDDIKSISTDMADATKEGVEITTRAIKNGIVKDEDIYCKYCGEKIDNDSVFCKACGKKIN